jgi:hypothetical protein
MVFHSTDEIVLPIYRKPWQPRGANASNATPSEYASCMWATLLKS